MTGEEKEGSEKYYLNDETAEIAQKIFENKELRALFDVQSDMQPEDLKALHDMALDLKRKERIEYDYVGRIQAYEHAMSHIKNCDFEKDDVQKIEFGAHKD